MNHAVLLNRKCVINTYKYVAYGPNSYQVTTGQNSVERKDGDYYCKFSHFPIW